MNGNILGEEIAKLILDPGADQSTKKKITEMWQEICGTIVKHIKDNAETVLMNIIRGSGTQGLKGIEAKRDNEGILTSKK